MEPTNNQTNFNEKFNHLNINGNPELTLKQETNNTSPSDLKTKDKSFDIIKKTETENFNNNNSNQSIRLHPISPDVDSSALKRIGHISKAWLNEEQEAPITPIEKEQFILKLKEDPFLILKAEPKFKKDKEIALIVLSLKGPLLLEYLDPEFRKDKEIALMLVRQKARYLMYLDPKFKKDKEIGLIVVDQNGNYLGDLDPELKNDKDVALAAVRNNWRSLKFIGTELKKDPEIFITALENARDVTSVLDYADPEIYKCKSFILKYLKINFYKAMYDMDPDLKKDKDILLTILKLDIRYLEMFLNSETKKDKDFFLAAVKINSNALKYADPALKNDKEFLLLCLSKLKDDKILSHIDKDLLKNNQFRKEACACNPIFLLRTFGTNRGIYGSDVPIISSIENSVKRIRKPHIQNLLFRMATYLEEEKGPGSVHHILQKKSDLSKSYPNHLKLFGLCLKTRFPDKDITPYLDQLDKKSLRSLIKDQNNGIQEALIRLLALAPCLQEEEIEAFFMKLPKPSELKDYLSSVSIFISVASDEERKDLTRILYLEGDERKEKLMIPCTRFLTGFISPDHLKNLNLIISNPVSDQLLSYLALHKDNDNMRASIECFLNAILNKQFPETRYHSSNPHLKTLAETHSKIFSEWKNLSSFAIQAPLESGEKETEKLNFQDFFLQKLNDGHLHQDLASAIRDEKSFPGDLEKENCLSYLNELRQSSLIPSKDQIEKFKTMLNEAKLSTNEFEHDLDSLFQKEVTLSKIEVSDKWEDLLLSGIEGSCQRVDGNPELNKCLLAYVLDAKNQMLCAKDPQGKIVGRSILRLLLDENQNPCIFMERFYGNLSIKNSVEKAALKISQALNLPLYETGTGPMLHSLGSSVAFEYSDAYANEHRNIINPGVTNGIFEHSGQLYTGSTGK